MEVDIKSIFDALEDCSLVDIVVASVYDANGFGPAFLCCTDGCPEDSFAAAASVAEDVVRSM